MLVVTVYIDKWDVQDSKFRHGIEQHDWGFVGSEVLLNVL